MSQPNEKQGLFKLLSNIKIPFLLFSFGILMTIGSVALSLILPLTVRGFVNGFKTGFNGGSLLKVGLLLVGSTLFSVVSTYTLGIVGQRCVAQIRAKITKRLLLFPLSYFEKHRSGDIASHINNDTQKIDDLISKNISFLVSSLILMIGSLIILLVMNLILTLIIIGALVIMVFLLMPINNQEAKIQHNIQSETGQYNADMQQSISNIKLIKISNAEKDTINSLTQRIHNLYRNNLRITKLNAIIDPVEYTLIFGTLFLVFIAGGVMVSSHAISIGTLTAFLLYVFQIITPVANLSHNITDINAASGASQAINEMFAQPSEVLSTPDSKPMPKQSMAIQFRDVSFRYPDSDEETLADLNLSIQSNGITAFVGPSGSGKTTILNLIERFYPDIKGQIDYGNDNINDYSLASWRAGISYVSQEQAIMFGTIRDNLILGLEQQPTEQAIQHALVASSSQDFVQALPDGLDTKLSEKGQNLSGGQVQRLMIARALLRDTPIIILDEATANLDSGSEQAIDQSIGNLKKNKTIIIVAHRLSTVKKSNRIYFIQNGRVTGSGTHDELIEHHQLYRQYVQEQLM